MTDKRYELDEGTNGPMICDNAGPDDYYFINDSEELQKFVDSLNDSENTWKENYNHVMGEYKKQLIEINEKDLEIARLKKENETLKLRQQLTYSEKVTNEVTGNKLYIKDTNTEITMKKGRMNISCIIPFNKEGHSELRTHQFAVTAIYSAWK